MYVHGELSWTELHYPFRGRYQDGILGQLCSWRICVLGPVNGHCSRGHANHCEPVDRNRCLRPGDLNWGRSVSIGRWKDEPTSDRLLSGSDRKRPNNCGYLPLTAAVGRTFVVRLLSLIGRRPTLPHTRACSTIGAERLNFRVRYGNGWNPLAVITRRVVPAHF